ncbi:hypothetical protein LKL35_37400 [Streptomyces sp. ET3-23]|uniref:hypothetical protein n=1 Tax=Streptomyces sp. ET3-23 TaxID=2885643 RepID=UPI001D12BFEC|nr:hypothetical protein [Streptomyces sp. ET3-23]MCC2280982.1 hypothetical protein [Streptomyces sp. ET3-23]
MTPTPQLRYSITTSSPATEATPPGTTPSLAVNKSPFSLFIEAKAPTPAPTPVSEISVSISGITPGKAVPNSAISKNPTHKPKHGAKIPLFTAPNPAVMPYTLKGDPQYSMNSADTLGFTIAGLEIDEGKKYRIDITEKSGTGQATSSWELSRFSDTFSIREFGPEHLAIPLGNPCHLTWRSTLPHDTTLKLSQADGPTNTDVTHEQTWTSPPLLHDTVFDLVASHQQATATLETIVHISHPDLTNITNLTAANTVTLTTHPLHYTHTKLNTSSLTLTAETDGLLTLALDFDPSTPNPPDITCTVTAPGSNGPFYETTFQTLPQHHDNGNALAPRLTLPLPHNHTLTLRPSPNTTIPNRHALHSTWYPHGYGRLA